MGKIFAFGEAVAGYDLPVLNEREVRAAAGILFFGALVSFMNAWLAGNFQPIRVFVVAFLIDFTLRVLVNPRYAPSMVLGRLAVAHQAPEWVGAPQKRFAWSIGLVLATVMLYLVIVERVVGPLNLAICSLCLLLLFCETAFGVCLACIVYNAFHRQRARHCPGGVCDTQPRLRIGTAPLVVLAAFAAVITLVAYSLPADRPTAASADPRCVVPDWAKAIGHEEMWKLHNNCQ
ncbi:DUF4395 domain-containing protein [Sulfurivermis fontis]|uniref:DUF4395 domain-containing protein n=1 Tax=Sulfurivermis fontis TaxID=1972068 RepID=UPI0015593977|nr:DUF4395 domain-containing protein [Sulfurivermis fontis]